MTAAAVATATEAASSSRGTAVHAARRAFSARPAESDWEGGDEGGVGAGFEGGAPEGFEAREWSPAVRRTGALAMKVRWSHGFHGGALVLLYCWCCCCAVFVLVVRCDEMIIV